MNGRNARDVRRASREAAASASETTDRILNAVSEDTDTMLIQEAADRAVLMAWHSLVLKDVDPLSAAAAVIGRTSAALMGAQQARIIAQIAHAAQNGE